VLKLKKLQILGFKSFCDRTELQFPGSGVVGIVGPNGCGKSNIADAISWVLGEQSAKSLRGGRMEDVIFAGTRDRPATGMAEVSLTLIDPQEYDLGTPAEETAETVEAEAAPESAADDDGWEDDGAAAQEAEAAEAAPAAGSAVVLTIRKRRKFHAHNRRGEVVVTRRLFRSGDSEYLMNGRPCRLRDIQDLFMGTGLGPESYAIIEQGRIGQILSSKPYDRRAIIEEAAGVSKYKAKKRLAEARLEASRLNLSRINDIFEEVTRQVGSLKRQAAKAQRYQVLKAEFDQQQQLLLRQRAQTLAAAQEQLQAQHEQVQGAVRTSQAGIERQEAARAEAARQCAQIERELRHMTEEAGRLQRELEHTRQQIVFQRQQAEELGRRGQSSREECARVEAQGTALGAELEQARQNQDAAGSFAAAARAGFEERRLAHQAAQNAVAEMDRGIEASRRQSLQFMAQAASLGQRITQGETQLAALERQIERLLAETAAAQAELEAGGVRRGQLGLEFQDQEAEAKTLAARVQELEQRQRTLKAEEARQRVQEQAARSHLAEVGARRRSLEDIVAHHGYSSEAVKRLFADRSQPGEFQPLGVLGEFVEVDAPYDQVVEQFLHDELNYVVVKNWDQAGAGLGLVRAQEQGRATFLVHGDAPPPSTLFPMPERTVAPEPGLVALLGEVKALNGFRKGLGEILPKLRDAYFAEDRGQAQRLADEHPWAFFLTGHGECFHNYTVTGGARASHGPLSLKRELRDLARRESEGQVALTQHEQRVALLNRELEEAAAELDQTRTRRHELEKRLLTSSQAVRQVENELQRSQARLQQAQIEHERARGEQRQTSERLQAAREDLVQVDGAAAALRQGEAAATEAADQARAEREAAAAAMSEAQAERARVEERARAAVDICQRLQRQQQELAQRVTQLRAEADGLLARQAELTETSRRMEETVARLEQARAAATENKTARERALVEAQAGVQAAEAALADGRRELDLRREALNECEVSLARVQADWEHLRELCRNDLGQELEPWLESLPPLEAAEGAAPPDLAAVEAAVRDLRQRIENLGPVNMMALEEFEEAQQRHTFMETQRRDLLDSVADTQKAIQEMDAISRQKFQEAFERINEYFQESFRVLFGGGQGFLRLSEIEGAVESGVDIVAQPPGKKLQNALLLSGGEKAMTAMALLLAVFRYQPSPFCLLDEVDAPMDEANVGRFSEMVKQMGAATQFILITHNRRTMEAAPTLYGVTMPQPGVSRLVSVMVEEARRAVAS